MREKTVERPLPLAFSTAQAAAAGYSAGEIRARLANGTWRRLHRGVYVRVDLSDQLAQRAGEDPRSQDSRPGLAEIGAAHVAARRPVSVSGRSARLPHELPEAARRGETVRLTCEADGASNMCRGDGFVITPAGVPLAHRTRVARLRTLTVTRLTVDALRLAPLAEALMVGDGALRRRLADEAEIDSIVADCAGWPGILKARWRRGLLDRRHESPLESASVAMFVEQDIALPEPQRVIYDRHGRFVARADFAWVDKRVLGAADGRAKYVDDLPGAGLPDERWRNERRRQADAQDAGWEMVRWTDAELRLRPLVVRHRILKTLERARLLGLAG